MDYADLAEIGDVRRLLLKNVHLAQQSFASHIAGMYPHLEANILEYVDWQAKHLQALTVMFLVLAENSDLPIKDILFHYHNHLSLRAIPENVRPLNLNLNAVGQKTYSRLINEAVAQILKGKPIDAKAVTQKCGITRGGLIRYFASPFMLADAAYQSILNQVSGM